MPSLPAAPIAALTVVIDPPGRVLVVDDLAPNVRLLSGILKIEGFEVFSAQSGPEALKAMAEIRPDVVLLDVMMPGMDGFEVCTQIRANAATAHVSVVMVTALRETADRVRAIEAGANDFLTKPVEDIEVVARVRSLVRAKRDHDALETAYRELKTAEELRDFLSEMLVHDLRTPLTTVLASLDLLQTGKIGKLDALQQEVTEMCARSGRHLLDLVNELLDISKLESGQMELQHESIDFAALFKDVLSHVETQARYNSTSVALEIAPDLPILQADKDLLQRLLINLLGNALKFTRNRGQVKVAVTPSLAENDADSPGVLLAVRDNGEGIRLEDQERIFSKFGQAQSRRAGRRTSTGLGLTFCQLVAQAHGGRIWVESEVGQGSTFLVSLPTRSTADAASSINNT